MFCEQDGDPFEMGKQFKLREMVKKKNPNEEPTMGTGVIKLRQVSEWKTLPLWTCNTLQALITDKDKQMSGYHSQHAVSITTGREKCFSPAEYAHLTFPGHRYKHKKSGSC